MVSVGSLAVRECSKGMGDAARIKWSIGVGKKINEKSKIPRSWRCGKPGR